MNVSRWCITSSHSLWAAGLTRVARPGVFVCLGVLAGLGCERTRDALQQDTEEAAAQAKESADEAKRTLEREVGEFKSEASAKLEQLSVSINSLEARAREDVDGSRQKLREQLAEARARVSQLETDGSAQWQQRKTELNQRIAELSQRLNQSLNSAGERLQGAGEKVQQALQPGEQKPEEPPPAK